MTDTENGAKKRRGCGFYALVAIGVVFALGILGQVLEPQEAAEPPEEISDADEIAERQQQVLQWWSRIGQARANCDAAQAELGAQLADAPEDAYQGYRVARRAADACQNAWLSMDDATRGDLDWAGEPVDVARTSCKTELFTRYQAAEGIAELFDSGARPSAMAEVEDRLAEAGAQAAVCLRAMVAAGEAADLTAMDLAALAPAE